MLFAPGNAERHTPHHATPRACCAQDMPYARGERACVRRESARERARERESEIERERARERESARARERARDSARKREKERETTANDADAVRKAYAVPSTVQWG
jgi:hypothetical protein